MTQHRIDPDGFGPQFLMIPGPSPVSDRVRDAMRRQSIDFSGDAFIDLANRVFERLKPIFSTQHEVFIYAANGHGAWEAALTNVLVPGDKVLLPETGLFSEAWREMAVALGVEAVSIQGDWRRGIDPQAIQTCLRNDNAHEIKAVLVVHTDTSSSVTSDLPAIRAAIDSTKHPALLMADAIASLCTTPLPMDAWGIDVVVAASQKALMVPPGLALVGVSDRALAASQTIERRPYYWSWSERLQGEHYKRFCGTAPEQLVFALDEAISIVNEEGLEAMIERHRRLAAIVQAAVGAWCESGQLAFNAVREHERSNSVTTVRVPQNFDAERVRLVARTQHNLIIGGGLGSLRGDIFRIGHMGYINLPYVLGALGALDVTLRSLKLDVGNRAMSAALDTAMATR